VEKQNKRCDKMLEITKGSPLFLQAGQRQPVGQEFVVPPADGSRRRAIFNIPTGSQNSNIVVIENFFEIFKNFPYFRIGKDGTSLVFSEEYLEQYVRDIAECDRAVSGAYENASNHAEPGMFALDLKGRLRKITPDDLAAIHRSSLPHKR
jgi:hypothetical protein